MELVKLMLDEEATALAEAGKVSAKKWGEIWKGEQ